MSISKLLKSNNLIFFVIALILMGFAIHSLGNRKNNMLDGMAGGPEQYPGEYYDDSETESESGQMMDEMHSDSKHSSVMKTNKIAPVSNNVPKEVKPIKSVDANELLPKNNDGSFFNSDLINAGRFQQQSSEVLRNANLQLRSDPPVGKEPTGPFNQPTIEPDLMRPQFELSGTSGVTSGAAGMSQECPMWQSSTLSESNNAILPPSYRGESLE